MGQTVLIGAVVVLTLAVLAMILVTALERRTDRPVLLAHHDGDVPFFGPLKNFTIRVSCSRTKKDDARTGLQKSERNCEQLSPI